MDHHLDGLAVESELSAFGGFLKRITARPAGMGEACFFVQLTTPIPHLGSFHLRCFKALK